MLKLITTLHIAGVLMVAHLHQRHTELRARREAGFESAQFAIVAAAGIVIALGVVAVAKGVIPKYTNQIK